MPCSLSLCQDQCFDFGEYNKKDRAQAISGEGLLSPNVMSFVTLWIAKVDCQCRVCVATLKQAIQDTISNDTIKLNRSACSDAAFCKFAVKQVVVIFLHYRRLAQRRELLEQCERKMDATRGEELRAFVALGVAPKIASDDANGDALVTELSAIFAGAMQGDGHGEGDGEGDDGQGQRGDDENEGNEPPAKKAKKVLKKPTSEIPGSDPPPAKAEKKPASATPSPKKPASATRSPLSMQRTARLARNARSVASPPTGREGLSQAAKASKPPKAAEQKFVAAAKLDHTARCSSMKSGRR